MALLYLRLEIIDNERLFSAMGNKLHILIIDELHDSFMESLERIGVQYRYAPELTSEAVRSQLPEYTGLVLRSKMKVDSSLISANPQLKMIARAGSGMDGIDLESAHAAGIHLINAPEGNRDAVGEQTTGTLLSLLSNINKGSREVRKGTWDREGNRGVELSSLTVGIIGYGNTGSAVAQKLSGFGCRVIAYDKYRSDFGSEAVEETSYQELIQRSDAISFHIPLTDETSEWIDDAFIASVNRPFYLLNLSRGGIMKTEDVLRGLESHKILGFGSDVLENERFEEYTTEEGRLLTRLLERGDVIVTPHVGGWTKESYERISEVLAEKVLKWINESVLLAD